MAEYIIEDNGWIENGGYIRPAPSGWLPPKPIVRCRDCKYFAVKSSDHEFRSDWFCKLFRHGCAEPDGFCKWGERRESE